MSLGSETIAQRKSFEIRWTFNRGAAVSLLFRDSSRAPAAFLTTLSCIRSLDSNIHDMIPFSKEKATASDMYS